MRREVVPLYDCGTKLQIGRDKRDYTVAPEFSVALASMFLVITGDKRNLHCCRVATLSISYSS